MVRWKILLLFYPRIQLNKTRNKCSMLIYDLKELFGRESLVCIQLKKPVILVLLNRIAGMRSIQTSRELKIPGVLMQPSTKHGSCRKEPFIIFNYRWARVGTFYFSTRCLLCHCSISDLVPRRELNKGEIRSTGLSLPVLLRLETIPQVFRLVLCF
jgi:hypothetical protein